MSNEDYSKRSILIVGGGTFGTSTAYHLAQRGYQKITVLDRSAPPSEIAAGNDINKIVRADYPEPLYARLATEATKLWRDPEGLYQGLYHRCGWILAASDSSVSWIEESVKTAGELGQETARPISAEEVTRRWPSFNGAMEGWKSFHSNAAGWVDAREALTRMARVAAESGVTYVSGDAGHVQQLLFDEDAVCIGARSADGTAHFADVVVLAAGAATASLLDMKGQLVAKGHTVGHLQLTPEEVEKYKDIPVVDHLEGGYFLPPQEDGIFKFAATNFVTNYHSSHPEVSLPRYRLDNPEDGIPEPIEKGMRNWLRQIIPEIAEREWFETRICWDADMSDYNFLIGAHPSHGGLKLAVGGSAHGFKFMPVIGKYIADMLEDKLNEEMVNKWKWRPGTKLLGANPHPTPLLDLNDIPGWKKDV